MESDSQLRTGPTLQPGTDRSLELAALASDLRNLVDHLEIDRLEMVRRSVVDDLHELRARAERILDGARTLA